MHDQLNYRYEIVAPLGKGAFGETVKCFDHKDKEFVAIKIIKRKPQLIKQGLVEVKILSFIKKYDT